MRFLLTNDDSHSSPLLSIILKKLSALGDVSIVVPKFEQSWTGKSISRFNPLHLDEINIEGQKAFTIDGTPADCVNIALYHLLPSFPDLIISGINAGLNAGVGFVFSSGTVGACLEGNIAGIPGIAISQHLSRHCMNSWIADGRFPDEEIQGIGARVPRLLDKIFTEYLERILLNREPVTYNFNLPIVERPNFQILRTKVGHTFYNSCFRRHEDRFEHGLDALREDSDPLSDSNVLERGDISLSVLDIRKFGSLF